MVVSAGLSYRKHIPSEIYHHDFNLDRFIPNRSAMNFESAQMMLTSGRKLENLTDYQKEMAEIFDCNRTRILEFKNKPPSRSCNQTSPKLKYAKPPMRHIPQCSDRKLDAVDVVNDYFLNLLDWSANNILALALKNTVYLWSASDGSVSELLSIDDDSARLQVLSGHPVEHALLLDLIIPRFNCGMLLPIDWTFRDIHEGRVGSLDWNNHILTTGSLDSLVINNDVRIPSHKTSTYIGHNKEICGLKWSPSGQQLASGGNDSHVFIWDLSLNQRRHRFSDHTAAVKALAWCPFQSNLLASGGGIGDRCIKLWNSNTGVCLNSVYTGSQVTGLLWNRHERELLSSHGLYENQLTLWKYPSMVKLTELQGHTSRVLNITQSPDEYTGASVGADESLQFWNVFGTPEVGKSVKRKKEARDLPSQTLEEELQPPMSDKGGEKPSTRNLCKAKLTLLKIEIFLVD